MVACVFPVSKIPTVEQSRKNQVGGKGNGSSLRVHQVPSVRDDFYPGGHCGEGLASLSRRYLSAICVRL